MHIVVSYTCVSYRDKYEVCRLYAWEEYVFMKHIFEAFLKLSLSTSLLILISLQVYKTKWVSMFWKVLIYKKIVCNHVIPFFFIIEGILAGFDFLRRTAPCTYEWGYDRYVFDQGLRQDWPSQQVLHRTHGTGIVGPKTMLKNFSRK